MSNSVTTWSPRFNWMARIEPRVEGPPAANTAFTRVRERAHGVGAGPARLAHDEDLDRAELAERHDQLEIAEVLRHRLLHLRREVLVANARDLHRAHARDVDRAVAVHYRAVVDVDLAPGADHQLVARADQVVRRDRDVLHRREGGRRAAEEVVAVERQPLAGGLEDEVLEFVLLERVVGHDVRGFRARRRRGCAGKRGNGGRGDVGDHRRLHRRDLDRGRGGSGGRSAA